MESSKGTLWKQTLAAGIAGTLADGISYPMMTVKSRLQVQGGGSGGAGALYMYRGPVDAIYTISAKEGWRTLYKGYGTVVQVFPSVGLYMATYQTSKKYLPGGKDNPAVHFVGGLLATFVQSSISVPLEIVRQRQMVQTNGEGSYTGSMQAAKSIYRQEGISAMYRGFFLAQMVWGPYNAIYLPLWESLKRMASRSTGIESVEKLPVQLELASAFCAASVAAAATNPMDIIKTRLQVQGSSNKSSTTHYTGALDCAKSIIAKEGYVGFTRGITSRVLWIAPSATIMFTTYDQLVKRFTGAYYKI